MPYTLTPEDRRTLDAVIAFRAKNRGVSPSLRALGEALGLTSPSSVKERVDRLIDLNVLIVAPSRNHAIIPTAEVALLGETRSILRLLRAIGTGEAARDDVRREAGRLVVELESLLAPHDRNGEA